MNKDKFNKAKQIEKQIFELKLLERVDNSKFVYIDNWNYRNVRQFPDSVEGKIQCKIKEFIKNEISFLEQEFEKL